MYTGLLHLHSVLRWVILILLIVGLLQAIAKKGGLKKTSLFLLISAHLTLLIGLFQYFKGEFGFKIFERVGSFGQVMKNAPLRFWAVEHISAMLLAIVLITMARGRAKKENFNSVIWLYIIATVLILAAVPWPFREVIARPWVSGM